MRDPQGQLKQVTGTRTQEFGATASADGKTLVWSQDERGDHNLYRFTTENTEIAPIAAESGVNEQDASLSADGARMAYTRGDQVMLWENGQAVPLTTSGSNGWPQLSADGRSVAFWSYEEGGPPGLYLFERASES
jgi:Tol biopolymer transport system component